jgi:hypothetical protein
MSKSYTLYQHKFKFAGHVNINLKLWTNLCWIYSGFFQFLETVLGPFAYLEVWKKRQAVNYRLSVDLGVTCSFRKQLWAVVIWLNNFKYFNCLVSIDLIRYGPIEVLIRRKVEFLTFPHNFLRSPLKTFTMLTLKTYLRIWLLFWLS